MQGIDKYTIEADGVKADVNIVGGKGQTNSYELAVPDITKPTLALVDELKHQLITEVKVSASEILDPKSVSKLKEKFKQKAGELLKKKIPSIKEETANFLIGTLLHDMLGFGKVEFLLNDGELEEIVVNSADEPIRVYHKKYGWLQTNITIDSEDKIQNISNTIARRVGRQITILNPLLDAHLVTGDRANAVFYPISNKGNTITIRKFARDPWTITDLIANKTTTSEIFALIWLAIQYEMNLLISGGTGSGKTSFLNVCTTFMPPNQRIISIEDTRELQLPKFLYWCPLTTRQPNPEGKGEVAMIDLLVNSLRMRPDRIILGEMRRKKEAEVLFEAMHTGHSVYATVHADSMNETIQRLINPPIDVPPNLLGAVNLNVVMFRDRRSGIRRTYQLGEFITSEESGNFMVKPNILYRWKPGNDTIVPHAPSLRLFEELSRHTGLSQAEINKELKTKKSILDYLVKNKIRSLNDVGTVMNKYYLDPDSVIDSINKDKKII
ncbi:MAG: Flp pilus assembly complex ATPase component TadA [Nanoarchaeota archaeon]|nr:Flp pilus assembly complex ATPase component TadA [Nanoarchaeota archaeon]MBU1004961.1 Flp pilus assembly complex ATPase component TadA [Nanoarchaeota archaeon]MBU1946399.1 Flp pilus assembly complex ATPase component TadA [Nanoarchaeota archaeon]